ncbi:MAG: NAD-dependent epimerase/dehydratase family protein [Candidatus Omnitrophica bacterium]|nr:NAD-dependent epimerase/dehydratase family protein [Candidatus Omnitrophota bacterium]MBU4488968.1 NAD-dependent epimerase/dehydratase family protein [Candidatus Omnitrophota bacterium]
MKAIVTGGAGFIGSHLVRRLLKEGWDVLVLDNLSSGYRENIPEGAEFRLVDLSEEDGVSQLPVDGVDVIFHLASHVGNDLSFDRPVYSLKSNILSTMFLLQWAVRYKVPQIVFASSVNVYGEITSLPVTEKHPTDAISPYAVGKLASESLCRIYEKFGVRSTCLRLFNVYGPGQDLNNMMQGMASIYMAYVARKEPVLVKGSLERFRDLVFIEDAVDAFYRCLNPKAYGKTYNVCTGRKTYVRNLLSLIIKSFGHDPEEYPIVNGAPTRQDQFGFYGDLSLIKRDLGWEPRVTLEQGIDRMAEWVRKMR